MTASVFVVQERPISNAFLYVVDNLLADSVF